MMGRGRGLVLALLLAVSGCNTGTQIDLTDRPLFDNGVNVFEAQVVDGLTGTLITDATMRIQVGRHYLDANNDNGFYTVYGIPAGSFRVLVSAEGYTDFRAMRTFTRNGSLTRGDALDYEFNNVLMYPVGTVPADLVVSVYDGTNGAPVPDATVMVSLESVSAVIDIDSPLAPNMGILPPTLGATSGVDGKATFGFDTLIMNGRYEIDVFGALDADGVYLVPVSNRTVTVGQQVQEIVVFLSRPTLTPVALTVNNEDEGFDAELVVTFPFAVELCSTDADHGWSNTTGRHTNVDTDFDGTVTSPHPVTPVTATLGAGNTELTLAFDTENDDAGDALYVEFWGVSLRPRGASAGSCTDLDNVPLRNTGGWPVVDTEIHVRAAP
ncbi:MAG: hypothetical protein P1V51_07730 [Deltaproteobacteria bacterium]|nr:hypothetical protein [Deltaproteobacteria bacterium]